MLLNHLVTFFLRPYAGGWWECYFIPPAPQTDFSTSIWRPSVSSSDPKTWRRDVRRREGNHTAGNSRTCAVAAFHGDASPFRYQLPVTWKYERGRMDIHTSFLANSIPHKLYVPVAVYLMYTDCTIYLISLALFLAPLTQRHSERLKKR